MYTGGSSASSSSKMIQHQQNSPSLNEYQAVVAAAQASVMNNPINYIQSTQALNMKMLQSSVSHSSMMSAHPSPMSSSTSLNQIPTSATAQMVAVPTPAYYMNSQPKIYNSLNASQYNAHQIAHHSLLGPVPINDLLSHTQTISKANSYQSMQMQANSQTLPSIYAASSYNYMPNQNAPPTQSSQITHQSQSSLITLTDATNPSKRANETIQSKVNTNTYSNAPNQQSKLSHSSFSNHRSKTIINKSRYYLNNKLKQPQQTNGANNTSPAPNESSANSNSNQKSQKPVDSASSDAYLSKLKNCIDANRRNINQRLYLNSNQTSQNSSETNANAYSNKAISYENNNENKSNQKSSNQQYHYQSNKPLIIIKPAENIDEDVLPKKQKRETIENSSSEQKGEYLQAQKKLCKPEQASTLKDVTLVNNKSSENGEFIIELNGTLYEMSTVEAQKQTDLNNNQLFSLKVNMFYCKVCEKLIHDKNLVREHMNSTHNVK